LYVNEFIAYMWKNRVNNFPHQTNLNASGSWCLYNFNSSTDHMF